VPNTSAFPEDAYEIFTDAFLRAAVSAGGVRSQDFALGGLVLRMEFAGRGLAGPMAAPFQHLRLGAQAAPDLVIRAWDSESTGVPLPSALPSPGSIYAQSLPAMSDEGARRWTYFRPDPGLTVYDSPTRTGTYWVPAASCLTYGDVAGGFRAIIAWAMAERGQQFLHSAAVAWDGRCALVVGASGSGKSSTALACLLAGMEYLGDDHCLLELAVPPRVHSVYAAAKLHDAQLGRFPELNAYVVNPGRVAPEKGVAILYPAFAGQLPVERPLAAVLVPSITGGGRTTIRPIRPAAALTALAPSTLLQMASADRAGLSAMARLVRAVPCYLLELGTEREEIARAVREFLAAIPAPVAT
jgi:hypothetical protein